MREAEVCVTVVRLQFVNNLNEKKARKIINLDLGMKLDNSRTLGELVEIKSTMYIHVYFEYGHIAWELTV